MKNMKKWKKLSLLTASIACICTGALGMQPVKAADSLSLYAGREVMHGNCGGTVTIIGNHLEQASATKSEKCHDTRHIASCWIYRVVYKTVYDAQCSKCGNIGTIDGAEQDPPVYEHRDSMSN